MKSGQFLSVIVMYSIVGSSFYIHSMLLTQWSRDNLFKFDVIRVSFIFLPKGGGEWDCMDYWGGKHVSVCKTCGKLGGPGPCSPGKFWFWTLLLDANWWNLGLFLHKHTLSFIVSLNYWFTCKIEFSAYPKGDKPNPRGSKFPPCPPWKKPWLCSLTFNYLILL